MELTSQHYKALTLETPSVKILNTPFLSELFILHLLIIIIIIPFERDIYALWIWLLFTK